MPADVRSSPSIPLVVAADHPSLPGHFPGNPVVPGVVLLERIVTAAEHWLRHPVSVAGLPQVKFVAPLRPGETAALTLVLSGQTLTYTVTRGDALVSRGTLLLRSAPAP